MGAKFFNENPKLGALLAMTPAGYRYVNALSALTSMQQRQQESEAAGLLGPLLTGDPEEGLRQLPELEPRLTKINQLGSLAKTRQALRSEAGTKYAFDPKTHAPVPITRPPVASSVPGQRGDFTEREVGGASITVPSLPPWFDAGRFRQEAARDGISPEQVEATLTSTGMYQPSEQVMQRSPIESAPTSVQTGERFARWDELLGRVPEEFRGEAGPRLREIYATTKPDAGGGLEQHRYDEWRKRVAEIEQDPALTPQAKETASIKLHRTIFPRQGSFGAVSMDQATRNVIAEKYHKNWQLLTLPEEQLQDPDIKGPLMGLYQAIENFRDGHISVKDLQLTEEKFRDDIGRARQNIGSVQRATEAARASQARFDRTIKSLERARSASEYYRYFNEAQEEAKRTEARANALELENPAAAAVFREIAEIQWNRIRALMEAAPKGGDAGPTAPQGGITDLPPIDTR